MNDRIANRQSKTAMDDVFTLECTECGTRLFASHLIDKVGDLQVYRCPSCFYEQCVRVCRAEFAQVFVEIPEKVDLEFLTKVRSLFPGLFDEEWYYPEKVDSGSVEMVG